tara:strand:- start:10 stop:210 length:201 start_codon:yes stop_codon:yes gene_type:complete
MPVVRENHHDHPQEQLMVFQKMMVFHLFHMLELWVILDRKVHLLIFHQHQLEHLLLLDVFQLGDLY